MNKLELDKLIDEYNEKKRELQKLVSEKGMDLLQKEFDVVFAEYPEVEKIVWTQYTPYFNDGYPCVFRVGELTFTLKNDENTSAYREGSILCLGSYVESAALRGEKWALNHQKVYETNCELVGGKERLAEISEKEEKISKMIYSLEEWLEVIYGDHVQVTVTKNGTDIEEYEHE